MPQSPDFADYRIDRTPWPPPRSTTNGDGDDKSVDANERSTERRRNPPPSTTANSTPRAVAANERTWVSEALCRRTEPDALFVRGAKQREAAVICRRCPVMTECGAEALDNRVEFGVWGGMTERQRRALLKQHPNVTSWTEFVDKRNNRPAG